MERMLNSVPYSVLILRETGIFVTFPPSRCSFFAGAGGFI